MHLRSRAMAWVLIGAGALLSWISGCSDLQEDCELLANCPAVQEPPKCGEKYFSVPCDECLQANCCQEVAECYSNNPCGTYCMFGIMPPDPNCNVGETGELFGALTSCMKTNCASQCGAVSYCNPVTHAGCNQDGTQCELVYPGIFACVPPAPPPAQLCQPCNFAGGPYCGSGLRCEITSLTCARYCCTNADCGTGTCELNQNAVFGYSTFNPADMVGLCMAIAPATGPACDAAALPPPSGGTCFVGYGM